MVTVYARNVVTAEQKLKIIFNFFGERFRNNFLSVKRQNSKINHHAKGDKSKSNFSFTFFVKIILRLVNLKQSHTLLTFGLTF